jgi:hypothetical protein
LGDAPAAIHNATALWRKSWMRSGASPGGLDGGVPDASAEQGRPHRTASRRREGFEEHATGRRRRAAAESLARATGVDYAVAYRHLANNRARVLIESRGRVRRRPSSRSGTLDPKQCLLELWSKREL